MNPEARNLSLVNDTNSSFGAPSSGGLKCAVGGSSVVNGFEARLTKSILADDKAELHALWPPLTKLPNGGSVSVSQRAVLNKLLHVCCAFDAVQCATLVVDGELGPAPMLNEVDGETGMSPLHKAASANAARCIEMLVRKRARTDQRTRDGNRLLPLELSLSRIRADVTWNPDQHSVEDLVVQLSEKDLKAVVVLCDNTKEMDNVVYKSAVGGHVVDIATLLVAAAPKVNELVFTDPESKHKMTIYECVIKEAITCERQGKSSSLVTGKPSCDLISESESSGKRKLLLFIAKLFQLFGVVSVAATDGKMAPGLIFRASKVGDEDVLILLLKHDIDVNATDGDGNSALHWCLRTCKGSCPQRMKIMLLLLEHGARANKKNNWGLTAVHIAAENGNSEALQVLLLEDPTCTNRKTEMKETPLHFAVKNDHKQCVEILLRFGATTNIFNLRKQRPIDLAESQDMRFLLNQTHISPKNRPSLEYHAQEDPFTLTNEYRAVNSKTGSPKKDEICVYFDSASGCARGEKCFYLHGDELRRTKPAPCRMDSLVGWNHARRIFVGGLHRSLDSDSLRKVFEDRFGCVEDARVIGARNGDMSQSRGFGFVTFKDKRSVAAAIEARHVTILGKQVEIKSVVSKGFLLAEFQQSLQQRCLQQIDPNDAQVEKPKEKDMPNFEKFNDNKDTQDKGISFQGTSTKTEEEMTQRDVTDEEVKHLKSWVDILCQDQQEKEPLNSFSQPPKERMHRWLGVFRNWLPGFLRKVSSRAEQYALSSLKSDFRAAFGIDLDHHSLGYSKLSDFIRCFPDLCHLKFVPIGRRNSANHMILIPALRKPTQRLLQSPTIPRSSSHKDDDDIDDDDDDDNDDDDDDDDDDDNDDICDDEKSSEDHLLEVSSPNDESSNTSIKVTMQNDSPVVEGDLATSGPLRYLLFLKPDPLFLSRSWLQNEGLKPGPEGQHMVLELAIREKNNHYQSTFFLREYDYYEKYKASIREGRCCRCNLRRTLWANFPCRHLLWCSDCKMKVTEAAGSFNHKCVVCDCKVEKIDMLLHQNQEYSNGRPLSGTGSFLSHFPDPYTLRLPIPWNINDLPRPAFVAAQCFM